MPLTFFAGLCFGLAIGVVLGALYMLIFDGEE